MARTRRRALRVRLKQVAIPPSGPTPSHSSANTGTDGGYPCLRGPEITSFSGARDFKTLICRSQRGIDAPSHLTGRKALSWPIRLDLPPASRAAVKGGFTLEGSGQLSVGR